MRQGGRGDKEEKKERRKESGSEVSVCHERAVERRNVVVVPGRAFAPTEGGWGARWYDRRRGRTRREGREGAKRRERERERGGGEGTKGTSSE